MIKLTRLDGQAFILNADLIRYVESRPDTFITLVSGERIVVEEGMQQVVELAVDYQQRKALLPLGRATIQEQTEDRCVGENVASSVATQCRNVVPE